MSSSEVCAESGQIVKDQLVFDKDSKSTKRNMLAAMSVLTAWMIETSQCTYDNSELLLDSDSELAQTANVADRNPDSPEVVWLLKLSIPEIESLLSDFYSACIKKDGTCYKISGFKSIRYGISKFFESRRGDFDIVHSLDFKKSNIMFTSRVVELKRQGFGGVNHYPEIEDNDLSKLYSAWDLDTPQGLLDKVQFDIMFYLCRRGQENLREMKKDHFALGKFGDG